jgi:hypothetical protein
MARKKNRWVNDKKIDTWLEKQLRKLDEWGGGGSAIDALANYIDDKLFLSFHSESTRKAQDVFEYINGALEFGITAERENLNIYYTYYDDVNIYILSGTKTDFKHVVLKAIKDYQRDCKPIEPEPPSPKARAKALLEEIRDSHVGDPKGQSDQEKNWCAEIDELVKLL